MSLNKQFFHILLLLIGVALLSSCSINQRIKKADKRYSIGEYYEAGEIYRSCYSRVPVKEKKLKGYVAFQQGECYRLVNGNPTRALNAYKNAIRYKYYEQDSIVFLRQAQLMQQQGKYSEAQKSYEAYLQTHPTDYVALSGAYACKQMAEWKKQKSRYRVQPVKEFNQKRTSNFAPAYIGAEADAIVFTSNRTPASKKTKKNSSITGVPVCALYSTRLNAQGKWEEIEKILDVDNQENTENGGGSDSSGEGGEGSDSSSGSSGGDSGDNVSVTQRNGATEMGVCCFSADGRTMYFTYSKPINGKDQGAKIYMSNRASGEWGEPQEVKLFNDSTISCGHPALSASGDTLYFASDNPDGYGGKDLYMAEWDGSAWTAVQNLGSTINTADDEMFPSVRKDGSLYFSSKGHAGYGGLDIFRAERQDSVWHLINLGAPFNSSGDDFGITFAGETENGFFSSNRGQKKGYDLIYSFTLPEMIISIEGKVTDAGGEALGDGMLRLVGDDGTNTKMQVKKDGSYKMKLKQGVRYAMLARARGHLNQKQELTTKDVADSYTFKQDFSLAPISKPVTMDNIFYEFAKWELTAESETGLNSLIKLLNDNPNITIELAAHTDRVGNDSDNKQLSEKRAQSVVNYLIDHGIEKERLTAVGYGEEKPVVADKQIHKKYSFIPEEQELNEEFILTLKKEQQQICDQINRRTEFRVLSTTYKLY